MQPLCTLPHMATLCSWLYNRKSSISSHQCTNWRSWTHPHLLTTTHTTLLHLPTHHNDWTWHPSTHSAIGASTATVALHFRYTVLHTNTIAAKLYHLRCKFRCRNAHPQHTIENRIAKAHFTLMISNTYPGPPSMPRSVTLAKLHPIP